MNKRLLVIPLAAAAAAAIAIVAVNSGADFSATSNTGTITGQAGTVTVLGNHNGDMDITFDQPFTPGVWASSVTSFTTTGTINEDVYVTFPTPTALHAFNQIGRYAQAEIDVDGNKIWSSANLNDGYHGADVQPGPFNCSTPAPVPPQANTPQVCPLDEMKLLSNIPAGDHTFTFWFKLNSKADNPQYFVTNAWEGGAFNAYPVNRAGDVVTPVVTSGLPYAFYAVQTGGAAPATDIAPAFVGG